MINSRGESRDRLLKMPIRQIFQPFLRYAPDRRFGRDLLHVLYLNRENGNGFQNCHGTDTCQLTTVKKWRTRFLQGRTDLFDDPRSGRPLMQDLTAQSTRCSSKSRSIHARFSLTTVELRRWPHQDLS
jgi:hypothetical protein